MTSTIPSILIVDDEEDNQFYMEYNLKPEGYTVYVASSGEEAIQLAQKVLPNLIILDLMMPEMDGIETCEEMRTIPALHDSLIVFWSARDEDYSLVAAYDAGADDYITKPIKPKLLRSKVKALLKRVSGTGFSPNGDMKYELGDLLIDRERYLVTHKNKEIILPKKEFELLILLASKPEKVFTREEIYGNVWGNDFVVGERTIDVHIRKLREKIGDNMIKTIKGIGYRLTVEA